MFKYIKKLTSVVVMFAVIIVFSSSNVYAVENQTYNPLFRLFAAAIKLEALDLSAEEIYEYADGSKMIVLKEGEVFNVVLDRLKEMRTGKKSTKYTHMSLSIKLSQKEMRENFFDSKFNDETEKYELTAKGMAEFEAAKARGGDGGGGGGGGGM